MQCGPAAPQASSPILPAKNLALDSASNGLKPWPDVENHLLGHSLSIAVSYDPDRQLVVSKIRKHMRKSVISWKDKRDGRVVKALHPEPDNCIVVSFCGLKIYLL